MKKTLVPLPFYAGCWLVIMVAVMSIAHVPQLPLWSIIFSVMTLAWSWLVLQQKVKRVSTLMKHLVMAIVVIATLASAISADGLAGLSTLLVTGSMLKLLETRTRRDGWVLVLASCFATAVSFLFNQTMLSALLGLISIVVIFCALVSMHSFGEYKKQPFNAAFVKPLRRSSALLVQSLPMMIVLFVVFPRIGPLWSVEYKNGAAKTGLSESISPGQVGRLTRSDAVAFRVSFEGDQPPPRQDRYWRAMTLSRFDGEQWFMDDFLRREATVAPSGTRSENRYQYQVIAEPSANPWLFLLDYPTQVSGEQIQLASNKTTRAIKPLDNRFTYQASSVVSDRFFQTELKWAERYTAVPNGGNPKTRALVAQWREQRLSHSEIIEQIYNLFNRSFRYTLSPPVLVADQQDAFLFDTQAGFCEHFASATAYMLRLAGIPARLVGGYQGGEWNAYESYMLVRQFEAHAWVEYWQEGEGWIRLDPTAFVAPERIEQSFDQLFGDDTNFAADSAASLIRWEKRWSWVGDLRLRYDAVNYRWHRWILGYHETQQLLLSDWLSGKNRLALIALVVLPVSVFLAVTLWWLLRKKDHYLNARSRDIEKVSRLLEQKDGRLRRKKEETLRRYLERVVAYYPELAAVAPAWLTAYERLEYLPQGKTASPLQKTYTFAYRHFYRGAKRLSAKR